MRKIISVAIDGPAAAGKSTIAKKVAKILNFTYIDTGAMYRAFTYYVMKKGVDPQDEEAACALIPEVEINLEPGDVVLVNQEDVTKQIRETYISSNVSYIASYRAIRLALVEQQRRLARNNSVIMDGRDIGTYVLPDADVKIFQVASVHTRAIRRYEENLEKGIQCTLQQIEDDLVRRDYIDSNREFAPLRQAPDAVLLDTSLMSIEEVVVRVLEIIVAKTGYEVPKL
ncbi:MAG: (d)CMP kinase [Bacilli bacterium]|jgi:cytidylate kinase|nr:(d)CMP kinase [Bacilli bacterium]MCH4202084.1 (d)CMP kinase [Bacilli bacterium]MCH4235546.1 (d)CMP kinase [Bacilli bacterium]